MNIIRDLHFFWARGGFAMWIILSVFAMALVIIIDRIMLIMRYRLNADALWQKVRGAITQNRIQEAISLCNKSDAPLPRIFCSGLKHANSSEKKIQNSMDEVMLEVIPEMEKRTAHLTILANISTLAGLLGTIFGLRSAFTGVSIADPSQKAGILAAGIAEALNATAFGLFVAVGLLLSYSYLQSKITSMVEEIDEFSVKLINLLVDRGSRDGTETVS